MDVRLRSGVRRLLGDRAVGMRTVHERDVRRDHVPVPTWINDDRIKSHPAPAKHAVMIACKADVRSAAVCGVA